VADVVFLSSVFGQMKIAEPMGVCILTARLRERGRDVVVLEPSVEGWSVEEAVRRVASVGAPIVAISVLRDKNVGMSWPSCGRCASGNPARSSCSAAMGRASA